MYIHILYKRLPGKIGYIYIQTKNATNQQLNMMLLGEISYAMKISAHIDIYIATKNISVGCQVNKELNSIEIT